MKARPLQESELSKCRKYLDSVDDYYRERDRCLFEVGVNCGLRVSEIINLNIGQVLQFGEIVDDLNLEKTKGGKHRTVPVNDVAKEAIADYLQWKENHGEPSNSEAALFLSQRGTRMTRQAADYRLKRIFRQCRLKGKVTTHSMRKAFANRLKDAGIDVYTIKELLGHESLKVTQNYFTATEKQKRQAVAAIC